MLGSCYLEGQVLQLKMLIRNEEGSNSQREQWGCSHGKPTDKKEPRETAVESELGVVAGRRIPRVKPGRVGRPRFPLLGIGKMAQTWR